MIIPDVIVSWPRNCDYPLWRQFIHENRSRFNEVIIAFTETNYGPDHREFVRKAMFKDYVHFVEPRPLRPGEDWRNAAINDALLHSYNAEWIWFTEQDFIVHYDFWEEIERAYHNNSVLGVYQGDRLHPCSIFIRRKTLNETSKDFGIIPGIGDHFAKLQNELGALGSPIYSIKKGYQHLNGLSHNMTLLERGEAPNYKPEEFEKWLTQCFRCGALLDEGWRKKFGNWMITF